TTGGIAIIEFDGLTIGGVNNTLRGLFVGTSGDINVQSGFSVAGSLILADTDGLEKVKGGDTSGDVSLTALGATADVTPSADLDAITASRGSIFVGAGRDILFGTAGVDFDNDVRASGNVTLSAGRDITVDGFSDVASDDFGQNTNGSVMFTAGRDIN